MDDVVIRAEGLGKAYLIGHRHEGGDNLREVLAQGARNVARKARDLLGGRAIVEGDELEEVWALRDASFEVRRGEVLGVVGGNGAGKSTLLKILARITEPSAGRVAIRGRVASLLEVGTGFHSDLSGRENVFLNGAILGMSRQEIRTKFDEIVAFAEVERFIDTPVKRYSSGMYLRLAFAVAAHLEPEILLVDEVLAVGDAGFQHKCIAKMGEVARGGRTVFFVSHNMSAVAQLTSRALLIERGRLRMDGPAPDVISAYLAAGTRAGTRYERTSPASGSCILGVEVSTSHADGVHAFGEPLTLRFRVRAAEPLWGATLSFQICDESYRPVTHVWIEDSQLAFCREAGEQVLECRIPAPRLYMGRYTVTAYFSERPGGEFFEQLEGICPFEVSMHNRTREYPWRSGDCVYLEEAQWTLRG